MIALPGSLAGQRVIPVLVIDDAGSAAETARALRAGGILCVEVTLRTPAGLAALETIAGRSDLVAGAGTVLTTTDVDRVADAGASFIVTPGFDAAIVARARERGLDILPGAATATEVSAARAAGFEIVKLFPAHLLGGIDAVRALSGPFPDMGFVPSGGVSTSNLAAYLQHPNVPAVSGSWITDRRLIAGRDFASIERLSREAMAIE